MLFAKIAAPFALAASALAQTFSINTPASLIQCQPAAITWVGGTSPFILAALPAGQVSAPAIAGIATGLTASPYTWNVNLAQGLNITLRLTDNLGNIAYASPLVIQAGVSNACLNASASTSGLTTVSVSSAVSTSGSASATSSSMMTTTSASASGSSSASSTTTSGSSSAAATTSRASTSSGSWALPTAIVGVPAIAMAAIGGVAALL